MLGVDVDFVDNLCSLRRCPFKISRIYYVFRFDAIFYHEFFYQMQIVYH